MIWIRPPDGFKLCDDLNFQREPYIEKWVHRGQQFPQDVECRCRTWNWSLRRFLPIVVFLRMVSLCFYFLPPCFPACSKSGLRFWWEWWVFTPSFSHSHFLVWESENACAFPSARVTVWEHVFASTWTLHPACLLVRQNLCALHSVTERVNVCV